MSYELEFEKKAKKEWDALSPALRKQLKNKLAERLENPHVIASPLTGMPNCYKIKLRQSGYRLVYQVVDNRMIVIVLTVSRRDSSPYEKAKIALKKMTSSEH